MKSNHRSLRCWQYVHPCLLGLWGLALAQPAGHGVTGVRVPPGFTLTEFAGPELANDIYCLTIGPRGEIVVSGRGYVQQLVDENADGRADRAILLADHPKNGAMGLLIDGGFLYVMGDGGLRRMPWQPGVFTAKSELLVQLKTGGEHDAHAVSRGPDGLLYLLCGNTSGVDAKLVGNARLKKPTAGYVMKLAGDLKSGDILCDGFRNAYGFDWSLDGELFTYDSDNERCLGLPWYEGTRFYRIEQGGHYGWRSPQKGEFWRLPPYHPRVVAPLADLGRGSPTGVVCYRHQQFPAEYRGAFFLLDWTFGVIHLAQVRGDQAEQSVFLRAEGGHGFAPTAAAVHPVTGDLYVSSGGRGTRGAVYRLRHDTGFHALQSGATSTPPRLRRDSKTLQAAQPGVVSDPAPLLHQFRGAGNDREGLRSLCLLIEALGEVGGPAAKNRFKEGYALLPRDPQLYDTWREPMLRAVIERYPSGNPALDRELTRTMALLACDQAEVVQQLGRRLTPGSDPVEDFHLLCVLACCRNPSASAALRDTLVQALVTLDAKYTQRKLPRERHWYDRLEEVFRALVDLDPGLPAALVKHPDFGRPDHLLFTQDRRFPRREAAALWLRRVTLDREYPWSAELVQLLAELPAEQVTPLLRAQWQETALREALLPVLARSASAGDRDLLLAGLRLWKPAAVRAAVQALQRLPAPATAEPELAALVFALRRWHKDDKPLAALVTSRLQHLTGQDLPPDPSPWTAWVVKHHPTLRAQLAGSDGVDRARWEARARQIDWSRGEASRGEPVYRRHCAACHQGSSAVGPDLAGVGQRFRHEDLLTAIVQPSQDVSARYRTSVLVTTQGQTHAGQVIYEAVDGIILQTAAATTLRVAGPDIASRRESDQSLMPTGLLDGLTNAEIADLLAYLKRQGENPGFSQKPGFWVVTGNELAPHRLVLRGNLPCLTLNRFPRRGRTGDGFSIRAPAWVRRRRWQELPVPSRPLQSSSGTRGPIAFRVSSSARPGSKCR